MTTKPPFSMISHQRLHLRDEKAAGSNGGASVATTWTKHAIATSKQSTITGASVASDVVTLPKGTYRASGWAMAYQSAGFQVRLRNTSDGSTVIAGSLAYSSGSNNDNHESFFRDFEFTITDSKNFELQYYSASAVATNGLGVGINTSEVNVFAELIIEKIG